MSSEVYESNQGSLINISDIIWIFRKRFYILILLSILGLGASYAFLIFVPPSYKATATIVFDPETQEALANDTGLAPATLSSIGSLQREIALIETAPVFKAALAKLKNESQKNTTYASAEISSDISIDHTGSTPIAKSFQQKDSLPDIVPSEFGSLFDDVDAFGARVGVETEIGSQIISISFTARTPDTAAMAANALAEAFLDYRIQSRYESVNKATEWLRNRLAESRQKLLEADKQVEAYKADNALVTAEGASIYAEQLAKLNQELAVAQSKTTEAKVRLEQARQYLKDNANDYEKFAGIIQSTPMEALRTSLIETERKEAAVRSQFGSSHPNARDAAAELQTIRKRITEESKRHLLVLENSHEIALNQEESLKNSVAEMTDKTSHLRRASIELRQLERERDSIKTLYEAMLNRVARTSEQLTLKTTEFRILAPAVAPDRPKIKAAYIWAAGPVGGLGAACALVLLFELLRQLVKSREALESRLRVTTFGMLPKLSGYERKTGKNAFLARPDKEFLYRYSAIHPNSLYAETLRSVLIAVDARNKENAHKTFMLTSPLPAEGKTQIALNLSILSAAAGHRTLYLDLDLRKPAPYLSMINAEGHADLTEYLENDKLTLGDITYTSDGVDIIPSQQSKNNVGALIASSRLGELLAQAHEKYDRIWIDTAPAGLFADARFLASRVDGTLLITEWGQTPISQAVSTARFIRQSGGEIIGAIINGAQIEKSVAYGINSYGISN